MKLSEQINFNQEEVIQYTTLPNTEIKISRIALGCWALIGGFNWGDQDEKDSLDVIRASLDAGVNFFDTAPAYGDGASEELLGRAFANNRSEVVIATKIVGSLKKERVINECERSLKRLKTDFIDLYQLHWPDPETPIEETVAALQKLKKDGKIRTIGISNFGPRDFAELLQHITPSTNQMPYNLLLRAIEYESLPQCRKAETGVLCYSPIMQGLLTGKFKSADEVQADRARTRHFSSRRPHTRHGEPGCEAETFEAISKLKQICEDNNLNTSQASLAWLLAQSGVTAVLPGARTIKQAQSNSAAADLSLPEELIKKFSKVTDNIKEKLGRNIDPWQSESRIH